MARHHGCTHKEGRTIEGLSLVPDRHDCDYVEARMKLIPVAEKIANEIARKEVPDPTASTKRDGVWTRAFHDTMQKLAREHNLIA